MEHVLAVYPAACPADSFVRSAQLVARNLRRSRVQRLRLGTRHDLPCRASRPPSRTGCRRWTGSPGARKVLWPRRAVHQDVRGGATTLSKSVQRLRPRHWCWAWLRDPASEIWHRTRFLLHTIHTRRPAYGVRSLLKVPVCSGVQKLRSSKAPRSGGYLPGCRVRPGELYTGPTHRGRHPDHPSVGAVGGRSRAGRDLGTGCILRLRP